ncbi:MAG: phage tail assembly chaperone [Xanthobacteraceae bacterium]|nr:phage tail assembly chaperone [Xanthobacteraceae bacterium]
MTKPFPPPFPWRAAMGFGLGVLRLSPDDFWRMTPRELAAAVAAVRGPRAAPLARGDLDRLMRSFPDHATETVHGR